MKVVWKSTNTLINQKSIEAHLKTIKFMQQLHEWSWLDKKLSKHFEKDKTE